MPVASYLYTNPGLVAGAITHTTVSVAERILGIMLMAASWYRWLDRYEYAVLAQRCSSPKRPECLHANGLSNRPVRLQCNAKPALSAEWQRRPQRLACLPEPHVSDTTCRPYQTPPSSRRQHRRFTKTSTRHGDPITFANPTTRSIPRLSRCRQRHATAELSTSKPLPSFLQCR